MKTIKSQVKKREIMGRKEALSKLLLFLLVLLASLMINNNMGIRDFFTRKIRYSDTVDKPISSFLPQVKAQIPVQYDLKDRGVQISDDDINAFRPLLYGEVSNRTPDKQALEANVIFNTALNRVKAYNEKGQKKTLSDVFSMPNQYQAYGGKQYQLYANPPDVVAAQKKKQVDSIIDSIHQQIKNGQYIDNTQGAYYYVHDPKTGKITYDNKTPLFSK